MDHDGCPVGPDGLGVGGSGQDGGYRLNRGTGYDGTYGGTDQGPDRDPDRRRDLGGRGATKGQQLRPSAPRGCRPAPGGGDGAWLEGVEIMSSAPAVPLTPPMLVPMVRTPEASSPVRRRGCLSISTKAVREGCRSRRRSAGSRACTHRGYLAGAWARRRHRCDRPNQGGQDEHHRGGTVLEVDLRVGHVECPVVSLSPWLTYMTPASMRSLAPAVPGMPSMPTPMSTLSVGLSPVLSRGRLKAPSHPGVGSRPLDTVTGPVVDEEGPERRGWPNRDGRCPRRDGRDHRGRPRPRRGRRGRWGGLGCWRRGWWRWCPS